MTKAIILARVSTPEQKKSGLSLDEIQIPKLNEYVNSRGFTLDKAFVFQETASQKLRKQFDEMARYIKKDPEIKAVVAYRIDRLTRNFRDAVVMDELRLKNDIQLHFQK